jgi:general stress protein YciG
MAKKSKKPPVPAAISDYMRKLGRKGGKASGAARMTNLSDDQRREIASKAARAMWAKRRAEGAKTLDRYLKKVLTSD